MGLGLDDAAVEGGTAPAAAAPVLGAVTGANNDAGRAIDPAGKIMLFPVRENCSLYEHPYSV